MDVVVKIGSSSLVDNNGLLKTQLIENIASQIKSLKDSRVVIVSSGAIAAGLKVLRKKRSEVLDIKKLTAISSVGQVKLIKVWEAAFNKLGIEIGQILLSPSDFFERSQYLHARQTFNELLDLKVIPVVNENDAVCDDEIRFGDNDRLAALVANLLKAQLLIILTDTKGLYLKDPRFSEPNLLVKEVEEIDKLSVQATKNSSSLFGSGGMASKLAAAKIASYSGTDVVIAHAEEPDVVLKAVDPASQVGTYIKAKKSQMPARLLWIAFASEPKGTLFIDHGAKQALDEKNSSLLLAGVKSVQGELQKGDVAEVICENSLVAKGIVRLPWQDILQYKGKKQNDLPPGITPEVIHRDDLVLLG